MLNVIDSLQMDPAFIGLQDNGYVSEYDMDCPECGRFISTSCLAKTTFQDGACRWKGCSVGNEIRARHGLKPVDLNASKAYKKGNGMNGMAQKCACGREFYITAKGYTACAMCRAEAAVAEAVTREQKCRATRDLASLRMREERKAAKKAKP